MHDVLSMRLVQRVGQLNGNLQGFIERQPVALQPMGQRGPFEELHDEVVDAVLAADVEHGADVRVAQRGQGSGFPFEPCFQIRSISDVRCQGFHRNGATEAGVAGSIHLSHSAGPNQRNDLVRTEQGAGRQRHFLVFGVPTSYLIRSVRLSTFRISPRQRELRPGDLRDRSGSRTALRCRARAAPATVRESSGSSFRDVLEICSRARAAGSRRPA